MGKLVALRMCENCKFFGRRRNMDREPTGTCNRHAPDAYEVLQRKPLSSAPNGMYSLVVVQSPFPGVWPGDVCGEWEAKEEDK